MSDNQIVKKFEQLRQLAEDMLRERPDTTVNITPFRDFHELIHELEVYQIELEMQHAQLERAFDALGQSLAVQPPAHAYGVWDGGLAWQAKFPVRTFPSLVYVSVASFFDLSSSILSLIITIPFLLYFLKHQKAVCSLLSRSIP